MLSNLKNGMGRLLVCFAILIVLVAPAAAQKKKKLPSQKFKGYGGLPEPVRSKQVELPSVSPVNDARIEECRQAAAKIDELVESNLSRLGKSPNPESDDYTFIRRLFLDTVGTIPTLVETNAFCAERNVRKREVAVDRLLSSYGYVSHMHNFWANILRLKDRPSAQIWALPYRQWIKEQLRINRPYDEWVYDMLTAQGKLWENPAVGYTLRDNGMPLVHVDNTVRVFLGTQIGCAQCHDHPFDRWTQKEFYQLAAFVHGTRNRDGQGTPSWKNGNPINRVKEEYAAANPGQKLTGAKNQILQANLIRVSYEPGRKLRLPHDYQYSDGKPKQLVEPKVLWGEIPASARRATMREQYAAWLTSADNPLFARTIANRLWKKVMGVGLIEPVDNIQEDSACENPELLDFLAAEMVRLDFDQKEFIRTLLFTRTYQRESSDFDPSEEEFYHYPGPRLRRLTAEQIWDSILTLAVYNPYSYELPDAEQFDLVADLDMAAVTVEDVVQRAKQYAEQVSPQALRKKMQPSAYRRQVLARASELPSPLPADHFIRQFGQCDRETIEGDSTQPTVPQILTMFNGPFTHMMLEKGSVIYDNLSRTTSPRDAMDVMFLSILNRPPTAHDREVAMQELSRGDRAMGLGNVVWALINTREFLFIQ